MSVCFNIKQIFCCKRKEKTPEGFCDGQRRTRDCLGHARTSPDKYDVPYQPENNFHIAVCMGDIERVKNLFCQNECNINDRDTRNRTALHFACYYGNLEMVQFLVKNSCVIDVLDDENATPLMKAVQSWEEKIVHFLLQNKADPNIKDADGNTALHHAIYVGRPVLAGVLLAYGASIEKLTKDGLTPLLLALREHKVYMAEYLIIQGADVHVTDTQQRNTLMYAVRSDSEEIVNLLLQQGVSPLLKDSFGWNASRYAMAGHRKVRHIILNDELSMPKDIQHNLQVNNNCKDLSSLRPHPLKMSPPCNEDHQNCHIKIISETLQKSYDDHLPVNIDQADTNIIKTEVKVWARKFPSFKHITEMNNSAKMNTIRIKTQQPKPGFILEEPNKTSNRQKEWWQKK